MSEWTSSRYRAPIVSAVFLAHPLGQALVHFVGLSLLHGSGESSKLQLLNCGVDMTSAVDCSRILDGFWRIVIGVGLVPTLFCILLSLTVPESALYQLEVRRDSVTALENVACVYGRPRTSIHTTSQPFGSSNAGPIPVHARRVSHGPFSYFIKSQIWAPLLGISMMRFLTEAAFSWFSLDPGRLLTDIWSITPADQTTALACLSSLPGNSSSVLWGPNPVSFWQPDVSRPCSNIHDVLAQSARQYIMTFSAGSIIGCICLIAAVNHVHRRQFTSISFLATSLLFFLAGIFYHAAYQSPVRSAAVALLCISHFMLYLGEWTYSYGRAPSYMYLLV